MEEVILVDTKDRTLGRMEKLEAHKKGLLHRAFSIFIFNSNKELLIHQRALHKYHSGGLWTNTCCSHPRDGESIEQACIRRLQEEMGIDCHLQYQFNFIYQADMGNGLTEHEFDHVFCGISDVLPQPNSEEVASYQYMKIEDIEKDIRSNPMTYTTWFKLCLKKYKDKLTADLF